jgi:hypothetical protein
VEYLGRYTHKIAISNQIKSIDGQNVITKITEWQVQRWHWRIRNLFGVLRCIFCPNVLWKYDITVLGSIGVKIEAQELKVKVLEK